MLDLLGCEIKESEEIEIKKKVIPIGYADTPGTGPIGEKCKTCSHCCKIRWASVYYKCDIIKSAWTHSRRTDICVNSPACSKWQGK